jgi:hypothetical protein
MSIYVFDTNVFLTLGHYYPRRFPTIWERIDRLATAGELISVREVRNELEYVCSFEHINNWVQVHRHIFRIASALECQIVAEIFQRKQYLGLVRRKSILKGSPVADPFVIASAKSHRRGCVVTQEENRPDGARIPVVCNQLEVRWLNLEGFLEEQDLEY